MTQKQVAARLGMTTDHVCRIETGKITPTLATLRALCRVLKTTPNKAMGWS